MDFIYALFNRQPAGPVVTATLAPGVEPPAPPYKPAGGFISSESIASFPGATAAISIIWGFINSIAVPNPAQRIWTGVAICVVVGLAIYLINITDPKTPTTRREKIIGFFIALINTMVLFMASFGVTTSTGH